MNLITAWNTNCIGKVKLREIVINMDDFVDFKDMVYHISDYMNDGDFVSEDWEFVKEPIVFEGVYAEKLISDMNLWIPVPSDKVKPGTKYRMTLEEM